MVKGTMQQTYTSFISGEFSCSIWMKLFSNKDKFYCSISINYNNFQLIPEEDSQFKVILFKLIFNLP